MLELFASDYRTYVQDILALLVCGAALFLGAGPERIVAITWLLLFEVAERVYSGLGGASYQLAAVDWFMASTDLIAGAVFVIVALYANRNYTLWIAGLQVLAMTAHLARGLTDIIAPIAYVIMIAVPGWFQLIFLAIGLARHISRQRQHGDYRNWRITKVSQPFITSPRAESRFASLFQQGNASWRDEVK